MSNLIKTIGLAAILAALVLGSVYFRWWRCGEMFPHAQFACFIGGK